MVMACKGVGLDLCGWEWEGRSEIFFGGIGVRGGWVSMDIGRVSGPSWSFICGEGGVWGTSHCDGLTGARMGMGGVFF